MRHWRTALLPPLLAVVFALLLSSVALLISGADPLVAFGTMVRQLFRGSTAVDTVNLATVYYLAGLAVAIGFQMNLFNIGVEGQYRFAAIIAAIAGGALALPPVLHTLAIILVAALAGAAYAAIPAILKVTRGVSEVISTIMLNAIVGGIIAFLVNPDHFGVQRGNNVSTREIDPSGWIPGIPLGNAGTLFGFVFIAALVGVGYWYMLTYTRFGFELKASGESPTAAAAGGVSAKKMVLAAMLLSGTVAGLIALPELLGRDHSYGITATQGYGFTGIAVALLGRNHPAGIAFGALLWAFLDKSAVSLEQVQVPKEIATIIQGTIVLSVVVAYEIVKRAELAAEQRRVGRALARNGRSASVREGGAV
ncbi:simple sugar transport system permease protein [Amycolatopsis arida]|uniref:Simple sugar transport system permease protein n=1 Tax=Amycolatopsis arida TaxID=587909 RepID=A0A1I5WT29_9PSEU|nr:ABC transporter permease [Amycolatopsis arida]TDX92440.1 simple sugar transport system permease protein [Amycolatopsis arida]SFQ22935.1 simple sugar transport system permease protein [Amycolatopsis arida]